MASLERASVLAAVVGDKSGSDAYQEQFREPQTRIQSAVGGTPEGYPGRTRATRCRASGAAKCFGAAGAGRAADGDGQSATRRGARHLQPEAAEPRLAGIAREASSLVDEQNRELAAASEASTARSASTRNLTVGLALLALVAALFHLLDGAAGELRAADSWPARMSEARCASQLRPGRVGVQPLARAGGVGAGGVARGNVGVDGGDRFNYAEER